MKYVLGSLIVLLDILAIRKEEAWYKKRAKR